MLLNKSFLPLKRFKLAFLAFVACLLFSVNAAATSDETYVVKRKSGPNAGGARITVHAPSEEALKAALDFSTYVTKFKRFTNVTLLGATQDTRLVYFEAPTGINLPFFPTKVWAVVEFHVSHVGEHALVKSKFIKGNLRELSIKYVIISRGDKSVLFVELLLVPKFPVLSSYVTRESQRFAALSAREFKISAEGANAQ